ncbi:SDR family NAD(P)-dependent oxidoreductase [Rhodococcus sovatensis]|uniref:SDR family oxidoreductase n=1 Tax=Rhodococcus sovatensis TaxID=1805840 RepID=A0ABZ2PI61_9NOCA
MTTPTHSELDTECNRVPDYRSLLDLSGRRYIVLGGGQGMGRQISHALAQVGAQVVVVDSDSVRADQVSAEIGAESAVVDATDDTQMSSLATSVGDVDGVVDVIGMARYASLVDTTDETWLWEYDIVLRHAALVVRHFGPRVGNGGVGSLTFVSSVSGTGSSPQHGAYGVFKAGLLSLVRTAAVELGPAGVRVNAVAPGFVFTPRISEAMDDAGISRAIESSPLQRLTFPSDVASALLFLVSDLSRSVTGHTLVVDAGATVKYPYDMSGF